MTGEMSITRICTDAYFVGGYLVICSRDTKVWRAFDRRLGKEYDEPVAEGADLEDVVSKLQSLTSVPNV
jgi:hypothetical protein